MGLSINTGRVFKLNIYGLLRKFEDWRFFKFENPSSTAKLKSQIKITGYSGKKKGELQPCWKLVNP